MASIAAAGAAAAVSSASAGSHAETPNSVASSHRKARSNPGLYVVSGRLVTSAVRCKVRAAILSSPALVRVPHYGFCRRSLLFICYRFVSSTLQATAA